VATLVAEGRPNDDVAREELMSVATVKTHLTHIFAKTGITTRAELAAKYPRP
jgi:DNA-binding CsgD family transcriptional regulator